VSDFQITRKDPIDLVEIRVEGNSHISIRNANICANQCENKACTYFCPTGVFYWDEKAKNIMVIHARCVECLACPFGCPQGNIDWHYPSEHAGVVYKYG
jgi:ferredoxin like protein